MAGVGVDRVCMFLGLRIGFGATRQHVSDKLNLGLLEHHALGHRPGQYLLVEYGVALHVDEHDGPALLHLGQSDTRHHLQFRTSVGLLS